MFREELPTREASAATQDPRDPGSPAAGARDLAFGTAARDTTTLGAPDGNTPSGGPLSLDELFQVAAGQVEHWRVITLELRTLKAT